MRSAPKMNWQNEWVKIVHLIERERTISRVMSKNWNRLAKSDELRLESFRKLEFKLNVCVLLSRTVCLVSALLSRNVLPILCQLNLKTVWFFQSQPNSLQPFEIFFDDPVPLHIRSTVRCGTLRLVRPITLDFVSNWNFQNYQQIFAKRLFIENFSLFYTQFWCSSERLSVRFKRLLQGTLTWDLRDTPLKRDSYKTPARESCMRPP